MTRFDNLQLTESAFSPAGFPTASPALETFDLKFSSKGAVTPIADRGKQTKAAGIRTDVSELLRER